MIPVITASDQRSQVTLCEMIASDPVKAFCKWRTAANWHMLMPTLTIQMTTVLNAACPTLAVLNTPAGDYVISTSNAHPNRRCRSSGETANDH